ncbi:hypothetical protein FOA52_005648 [Chlamydomonas sp. UWO 241]|nr:hypothetical protein FOA52_005648 [Chlamydomonas sp. UWO 241]
MESPKGVGALFCALCLPIPLHGVMASLVHALNNASPKLERYAWLAVAPLLWLARFVFYSVSRVAGVAIALTGFSLLLLVEAMAAAAADATAAEFNKNPNAARYHGHPNAISVFTPGGSSRSRSAGASVTRVAGNLAKDPSALKAVRAAVIRLENVLYGNELSESTLPADVLPLRVQKLCEDLNIRFNAAACAGNAAEMLAALKEVEAAVGA